MSRSIVRIVLCLIFGLAISSQVLADHAVGDNEVLPKGGKYQIMINTTTAATVMDTSGTQNLFLGGDAAQRGSQITAVGNGSGRYVGKTASYSTFVGFNSGYGLGSQNTGTLNSFFGAQSGLSHTSGSYNTFLGAKSGNHNKTGSNNVYIGFQSGYYGGYDGPSNNPRDNVSIGYRSAYGLRTGVENVNIGFQSGYANQTGGGNVNLGYNAGYSGTSYGYSTNIGYKSGYGTSTGYNVFLGAESGNDCTATGSIAIGYKSKPSVSHQAVIGGDDNIGYIESVVLGRGVLSATPSTTVTLQTTGAASGNTSGSDLLLKGGAKSGTGKDGIVKVAGNFKVSGNMTLPSATGVLSVANKIDAKEGEFDVLHIRGGADLTEMFDVRVAPAGDNSMAALLRAQGAQ